MRHLQTPFIGGVKFTSKVTGKTYFINEDISCNSDKCKDEYTEYIMNTYEYTKPRFSEKSSDIKIKKDLFGTSRHFSRECLCSTSPFGYVKVQIIEQVNSEDPSKIEEEKYFDIEKDTGQNDEQYL